MKVIDTLSKILWLALVAVLLTGGAASAQEAEEGAADAADVARARELFHAGEEAYSNGHFDVAYEDFHQAYELSHRPILLYNVGAALDRLGRPEEAGEYYQRYLDEVPGAVNQAYVQGRLAVIHRQLAQSAPEEAADAEASETADGAAVSDSGGDGDAAGGSDELASGSDGSSGSGSAESSDDGLLIGSIVLLGVGGAAAVAAVVTGLMANSTYGDLKTMCPNGSCPESARPAHNRLNTLTLTNDVLVGAAIASAGVGALLLILHATGQDSASSGATATAGCGPTGCSVAVSGRF